ncbi:MULTISPECIES: carboxymuconolactone decarboxylase family protein [unclassified Nocardiopsis]|uniref:carboxymuconolactone decarboxylase family protein n=1 Tax=unclassified Nocardiopsis TaxID=2649073 RepID=UPI00135A93EC|nr:MULTISPECIES: carboxymuconolactone decarboxylase family protein [unclassified Nocardiopsis]
MASIYRYTTPVTPREATGPVAAAYTQIREEFLLADGPLMTLSRVPSLLVAVWALLREAELAGPASRADRELVAAAVSAANRCPFCVDAHTTLGHAAGEHTAAEAVRAGRSPRDPARAALADWAAATAAPGELPPAPFPAEHTAAFVGTALVTHFINRVVTSLLEERLLPANAQNSRLVRRALGRAVRRGPGDSVAPGRSLSLLPPVRGPVPAWARQSPVGTAYTALREAVEALPLPGAVRARVRAVVAGGDLTPPPLAGAWPEEHLEGLQGTERAAARLALCAALAPHRVSDAHVEHWRAGGGTDADLVGLIALGAFTATDRVRSALEASARHGG